jgi:hypothetical protein
MESKHIVVKGFTSPDAMNTSNVYELIRNLQKDKLIERLPGTKKGSTGYLDDREDVTPGWGFDSDGRIFITLPKYHRIIKSGPRHDVHDGEVEVRTSRLFQRYSLHDDVFVAAIDDIFSSGKQYAFVLEIVDALFRGYKLIIKTEEPFEALVEMEFYV